MGDFEERLKRAMAVVEQRRPSALAAGAEFVAVLETFAKTLDTNPSLFVHAVVEKGPHTQLRSIVTSPKYRRDQRSYMLSFWLEGAGLKPMNDSGTAPTLTTVEELENYLLEFFNLPTFQSTLAAYEEICGEDVDGFLRTGREDDLGPKDVLVLVPAAEQKRLAEALPNATITMDVQVENGLATTGAYDSSASYVLSSGGFGVQLAAHHQTAEGRIKLVGAVLTPAYP